MKMLLAVIFFIVLSSPKLNSQLLYDNFEYPAGDSLVKYWFPFGPFTFENSILVTTPGLTFPYYAGSGIGNAAILDNIGGEFLAKNFSSNVSSGNLYGSFMVNVLSASNVGDNFATYLRWLSIGDLHCRVFVKDSSGRIAFGLSKTQNPIFTPAQYFIGTTYLLIMKYTFNPGLSDDEVSLFVFPTSPPTVEPVPTLGPLVGPELDMNVADRFGILSGLNSASLRLIIDGVYVDILWNNSILPIELASFNAIVNKRDVTLNWSTVSEVNNSGFDIEKSEVNGKTSNNWKKIGFVQGEGNSNTLINYSFPDRGLNSGKYKYRLKQIDFNGNYEYFNLSNEVIIETPVKFYLSQNYPNPFNPTTIINYEIPFDGEVSLKIFDMSGREVMTKIKEVKTAGYYTAEFNGSNLPSGGYFYKLDAGDFTFTRKMFLVK